MGIHVSQWYAARGACPANVVEQLLQSSVVAFLIAQGLFIAHRLEDDSWIRIFFPQQGQHGLRYQQHEARILFCQEIDQVGFQEISQRQAMVENEENRFHG